MQLAITNLLNRTLELPYLEKSIPAKATITIACAQADLSKMVDLQSAVAVGSATYQVTPDTIETASGVLTAGIPAATGATAGLQPLVVLTNQVASLRAAVSLMLSGSNYNRYSTREEQKAAQCPVAGAIVDMPLTNSLRNWGSLGGVATKVGTLTQTLAGVVTNGTSNCVHIVHGVLTDFTLVCMVRCGYSFDKNIITIGSAAVGTAGFKGWCVYRSSSLVWGLGAVGVANIPSAINCQDDIWHTVAIKRSGTTTTLYIDGVSACNTTGGNTGGTALLIGATEDSSSALAYFCAAGVRNVRLFNSALSDANRNLVEADALTTLVDSVAVAPAPTNPVVPYGDQTWRLFQTGEACGPFDDPTDPTKMFFFYSAFQTSGGTGFNIARAWAYKADPTRWFNDAANPIYQSGAYVHRLDSVLQMSDGSFRFYLTSTANNNVDLYTSPDGYTLTRYGSVLTATGQGRNDGTAVCQFCVRADPAGGYYGYYSHRGSGSGSDADLAALRFANSPDGLNTWAKKTSGDIVPATPETPWSNYLEWHSAFEYGGYYWLLGEVYDGTEWSLCMFYSTQKDSGFVPCRKNPLLSLKAANANVATPKLFPLNGQWYLMYTQAVWAQVYGLKNWDTRIAQLMGTPLDCI